MADILLNNGASANIKDDEGNTPLHLISLQCENIKNDDNELLKMTKLLIEKGNGNLKKMEINLTLKIKSVIIIIFLTLGGEINEPNNNEQTPLHHAVFHGTSGVALLLLEAGADVHAQDSNGSTALLLYLKNNRKEIELVERLLECGSEVNIKDEEGNTPLHLIINLGGWENEYQMVRIVQLFISKGKFLKFLINSSLQFTHINS